MDDTYEMIKEFQTVAYEAKKLHEKFGLLDRIDTDNLVLGTLEEAEESLKSNTENG